MGNIIFRIGEPGSDLAYFTFLWPSFLASFKNGLMAAILGSLAHPEDLDSKASWCSSKASHRQEEWNKHSRRSCHFAIEETESERRNDLPKVASWPRADSLFLACWESAQNEPLLDRYMHGLCLLGSSDTDWTFLPFAFISVIPWPRARNICCVILKKVVVSQHNGKGKKKNKKQLTRHSFHI